jgi:proliferating cell nuclear antigen
MSSANAESPDSSIALDFTAENVSQELGIQTQPAAALAELNGWGELEAGIENGRDWEEIDGVGPSTAETLAEQEPDLPVASPEPDVGGPEPAIESDESDVGTEEADEQEHHDEESGEQTSEKENAEEQDGGEEESSSEEGEDEDETNPLYEVSSPPSVFEATIEKSNVVPYFDAVSQHVDEAKVRIGDEGLNIRAVDPANVQMVDGSLSSLAFESYHAEMGVIGVNLERLNDILGNANKGDLIHFQLNPEVRKLTISVENLEFTMALIDPDSIRQEPDLPDLDLDAKIIMEGSVFSDAVDAIDMVTEHALFSYERGNAEIYGEGDTDDATIDLTDNDGVHDITAHDAGESLFSLDYLKNFEKMLNKNTTVTARIGNEFPIMVDFGLADGHIQIEGMLAPRIQSD